MRGSAVDHCWGPCGGCCEFVHCWAIDLAFDFSDCPLGCSEPPELGGVVGCGGTSSRSERWLEVYRDSGALRLAPSSAALAANRALRISWPISPWPPGFEGMNSTFDRPSWATFCMVSKYWVIISSCSA